MATVIINPPSSVEPVATSAVYSVYASTDKPKVKVSVIRDPDGENDSFFSAYLYAFNGIVEFSDIRSLIELRFRELGIFMDFVEIRFDSAAARFNAVYCEFDLPGSFSFSDSFLSVSSAAVVHRNSAISLASVAGDSAEFAVLVVGTDVDGRIASVGRNLPKAEGNVATVIPVNDIIAIADNSPVSSVSYFSVSDGKAVKMFFLVDHPFFLTFRFKNIFNVTEFVDVVGTLTKVTAVKRDMAFCNGKAQQYNQLVEKTYEIRSASLSDNQIFDLEQLIASRSVALCAASGFYDVIITDHSVEVDNDDENLKSVKFTFRFNGERPLLIDSELSALMPDYNRIFTSEFSQHYT